MGIYKIDDIKSHKNTYKDIPEKLLSYLEKNKIKNTKRDKLKQSWICENKLNKTDSHKFNSSVRELLNKINESNYDNIVSQIDLLEIDSLVDLDTFIKILLEKVVREEKYANIYAKLSEHLSTIIVKENDKEYFFKKLLLAECQKLFIKNTTQNNIRKTDAISYITFLSELFNCHMLSLDIIIGCYNILINKASNNNLMTDMIITMLSITHKELYKRDNNKYNNILNKIKILCDSKNISLREKILLAELLTTVTNKIN